MTAGDSSLHWQAGWSLPSIEGKNRGRPGQVQGEAWSTDAGKGRVGCVGIFGTDVITFEESGERNVYVSVGGEATTETALGAAQH